MIDSWKGDLPNISKSSKFNSESIKYEASSISDLSSEDESRVAGERSFGETGNTEKSHEEIPENVSTLEGPSNIDNFLDMHALKSEKLHLKKKARLLSVGAVRSDVAGVKLSPNKTSSGRRKPRMLSDPGKLATLLMQTEPEYFMRGIFTNPFISDFGKKKRNVEKEDFKMTQRKMGSVTEEAV